MTSNLRRSVAVVAAAVLGSSLATVVAAAPAGAANGLEPILDCVQPEPSVDAVIATFGYVNINGVPITPDASENYFDPPPYFRGQPTTFEPGSHHEVFQVTFPAGTELTWHLFGSSVTAMDDPALYCDGGPDTVPPNTALLEGPRGTVAEDDATFELFSEAGAVFECALDEGDFEPCDSPAMLEGLSDGQHTFSARAKDTAGNVDPTPATRTWTVDTTAPEAPAITSPSDGSLDRDGSFNVRGTAEPGSVVRLHEGTTRVGTSETDPSTGVWTIPVVDAAEGPHTYTARATDPVGNVSPASASSTVSVDRTGPSVVATSPRSGQTGVRRGVDVTATFSEAVDPATVASSIRLVRLSTGRRVSAVITYDAAQRRAILDPAARLASRAKYRVAMSSAVQDLAGNALDQRPGVAGDQAMAWTFRTGAR